MAGTTSEVHELEEQVQQQRTSTAAEQEKGVNVVVRTSGSDGSLFAKPAQGNPRPTFWQQFPWSGVGPLLGVIACSVCAVAVIGTSNNVPKSTWKLHAAPNVLVNILTAIAGILVTMAAGTGMAISWWRRALSGTSVEDLHYSWQFSTSTFSLIRGWKFWNSMALTAVCTKFAIIDSTLFQKALSTRTALGPAIQIDVPIFPTQTFPTTGTLNGYGNSTASMTYAMTYDTLYWTISSSSINSQYLNGFYECAGLCGLTYRSIGFESICTQSNVSAYRTQTEVESGDPNANVQMNVAFEQRWPTSEKNYSYINLEWVYWIADYWDSGIIDTTCSGRFINLTCELRPSIIDYPISTRNSSYTQRASKTRDSEFYIFLGPLNDTAGTMQGVYELDDPTVDRQLPNFTIINNIDVPESQVPGGNTSLGGIAYALQQYYGSTSTVSFDNTTTINPSTGDHESTVQPILTTTGMLASINQEPGTGSNCPVSYTADYSTMLASINTLMILVSDDVFSRTNYSGQSAIYDDYYGNFTDEVVRWTNATQFSDETYYVSRMGFAWAAFASTLLVVGLILPSYWRFWELGRRVTMGPIDIIEALRSPSFSHLLEGQGASGNGGQGGHGAVKSIGGMESSGHGDGKSSAFSGSSSRRSVDHV